MINIFFPLIRRGIFSVAIIWSLVLYYFVAQSNPQTVPALSILARNYGLTALCFLFFTLTPGLIQVYFPRFWLNGVLIRSRKALGISTFYFAVLHALIEFFNNLQGLNLNLNYLSPIHRISILLGFASFLILTLLFLTSFDYALKKLGSSRWKFLHRFIYITSILIVIHVLLIGSHFMHFSSGGTLTLTTTSFIYLLLEAGAIIKKGKNLPNFKLKASLAASLTLAAIVLQIINSINLKKEYDFRQEEKLSKIVKH